MEVLRYAAIVIFIVSAGFATYWFSRSPEAEMQFRIVQTESRPSEVHDAVLPDGSRVSLNADTRIEFPELFAQSERRVKMVGEAFFEVSPDAQRPFIIETPGARVEVLGTSFNVSAYPDNKTIEVNVKTGKVRLVAVSAIDNRKAEIILKAGTRGWINTESGEVKKELKTAANYLAWKTRILEFNRTPLPEVFRTLENIYHIPIRSTSRQVDTLVYTVNYAQQDLDFIVDVIARTFDLDVIKTDTEIVFADKSK